MPLKLTLNIAQILTLSIGQILTLSIVQILTLKYWEKVTHFYRLYSYFIKLIHFSMCQQCSCNHHPLQMVKLTSKFCIFKKNLPNFVQEILDQKDIQLVLQKQNWRIRKKFDPQSWTLLWQWMQESLCERLFIQSQKSSVLIQIEGCKFRTLKVLNLSHNFILNIQALSFIDAVNLEFIFLQTNLITSIKSLSKMIYKNLEQIDLSGNKILEIREIQKFKTNKQNSRFSIQLFSFTKSHHNTLEDSEDFKIQNISQIAKLEHFDISGKNKHKRMNYEMLKRQFQYLFLEQQTDIKLTKSIPQSKKLNSLSKKFCW